jgi:hypothetical protein
MPGVMPQNFSAAYALMFCAGVYFTGRMTWWLPLAAMLLTDVGLNCYYQHTGIDRDVWSAANLANLAFNYAAYAVLLLLGRRFKPQASWLALFGGGVLGAILFYFITNTASWFFNPFGNVEYTRTLLGWFNALTRGVGGYPETWEFFRNTLLSGGLFTGLFAAAMKLAERSESPADKTAGARDDEAAPAEPEEQGA